MKDIAKFVFYGTATGLLILFSLLSYLNVDKSTILELIVVGLIIGMCVLHLVITLKNILKG